MNDATARVARQGEWRYAPLAVTLHWLLAALIAFMAGLGWYMVSVEDEPGAERWFGLHQSVGSVVFALVLVRLLWRLRHRPAELPASVPRREVIASTIVQWLLYGCMVVQPLVGFVGSSYTRAGISLFGHALPRWQAPDHATAEAWFAVHETIAWIIVGLVAVHAAGGLKHALVDRDRVFQRMWF